MMYPYSALLHSSELVEMEMDVCFAWKYINDYFSLIYPVFYVYI